MKSRFVELASVKVAEPGSDRYPGAPALLAAHYDGTVFAALCGDGRMTVTAVEVDEEEDEEDGGGGGGSGKGGGVFSVRLSEPLELQHKAPFNPLFAPTGLIFRPRREEEEDAAPDMQQKKHKQKKQQRQQQRPPRFPRKLRLSVAISAAATDPGSLCGEEGRNGAFRGPWCLNVDSVDPDPTSPAPEPGRVRAILHRLLPPRLPRGAAAAAAGQRPPIDHVIAVASPPPGGGGSGGGVGSASRPPWAAGLPSLLVDREGTVSVSVSEPEAFAAAADAEDEAADAPGHRDDELRAPSLAIGGGRVTAARLSETESPGSFVLWLATERGAIRRVGVNVVARRCRAPSSEAAGDGAAFSVPSLALRELAPARHTRTGAGVGAAPPVALVPLPRCGGGCSGDRSALVWPREGRAEVVSAAPEGAPAAGPSPAGPPRAALPFRRVLGPVVDMDSTAAKGAAEGTAGSAPPGALLVTRLESGAGAGRLAFCSSSAASVTPGAAATTLFSTSGVGSAPGVGGLWSVAVPRSRSGSGRGGSGSGSGGGGVVMVSFASASRALAGGGARSIPASSAPSSSPSSLVDATAALGAAADESTLAFGEVFCEEGGEAGGAAAAVVVAAHATTARVRLCDAARAARVAAAAPSPPPPPPPILARDFLPPPGSSISAAATSGAAGGLVLLAATGTRGVTLLALLARAPARARAPPPPRPEGSGEGEEPLLPFGLEVAAELALPHEASCLSLQQRGGGGADRRRGGSTSTSTSTFEMLALVGTYRPGVSLLGVSVTRGAGPGGGGAMVAKAQVVPLADLSPPPPARDLGPLLGFDATAAAATAATAAAAARKQRRESSPREEAAAPPPPPLLPLSSPGAARAAALALPEPAAPNVPESVMLVLVPSDPGEEAAAHALVGWRCGALSHAAAVRAPEPPPPAPPSPPSPWRLTEPLSHVRLGSLPVSLRPAPPGLLPPPPSQGAIGGATGGAGRRREPKAVAVAVAVGEHAAVVSLDGGGSGPASLPLPARVSRLNLRGTAGAGATALHVVALWSGAAGGGEEEEEEEEEEQKEGREPKARKGLCARPRSPSPPPPPFPCLLVADADASLSLIAIAPDLSPLQLLPRMRGEALRPSRFSHVAALSFSNGGGEEEGGSRSPSHSSPPPAVVAAACEDAIVFADASSGEVILRHPVGRSETIAGLAAWGGGELLAGTAAEARLRACLASATAETAALADDEGDESDEDDEEARLPPRGRTMRQHQQRQGLAAALESTSEEEEEEEEAAAAGAGPAAAGAAGGGPVTRRRAAEAAAAAAAATAATATAPGTGATEEAEMLDAFEAEMLGEGEGREGEEGALGDDGEELLPASSLQPSSSPRPPPPPPPKSCSKSKGTPVSWLAFASNDETQGGMGRIRVLAFEMVSDAENVAADDDGDDGKKPHPSSPFPPPLAPRPFHPWRATVVAHVRCPRERVHALAALPDGGLAAAIERRLALLDVAAPPTPAAAAEAEATRAAMARITARLRSRHRGPDGRAAMAAVERAVTAAMEAAAGAARAPTSHPLSSAAAGDRRLRIPPLRPPPRLRGSLRARAVCRLRAGGDSAALSLRVLPAPTSTEPVSSSSGAVTSVIAVADGGNGPQRGGRSGCGLGGGGVGVSLFAVTAGPPPRPRTSSAGAGDDTEDDDAPPRRGGRGLLRPIAACSTPWAAAAVVPVAWPHISGSGCFRQDFGAVGGDALGGRLFALAPPPPLFRDGSMLAAAAAVNPERCLSDAAVGRMGGGSRVTCAVVLSCDDGDGDGDGERRRRRKSPERSGDDPLSSKKRKCREGLFLPSSSSSLEQNQRQLQHQQRQQQQQCSRRHPTWLFGNDAGALLAVRQVPRELGAALLLIQAALESTGRGSREGAAAPPPLAVPPSLKRPSISPPPQTGNEIPWRPFYPPWASVVADAAGREAAAAVLAAHADSTETETEAGEARVGGGEESLAAAAEAAVAAASMPPLSPRGVSTALAAALAAVAGGNGANRGNGSSGTGNNNSANSLATLAPAPASSAEAPAPFPPLSLPAPEEMDDHGRRARDEAAMRVAMRAFEGAKRATLAAIADGSHPLAERALRSSSSSSPSSQAPSSSSLPPPLSSSPPQFLDGDVLAAFFELPIPRRREVLDRLGSGGAVVAALALAAAGSGSNSCRPLAAAALRAAANAEAAAEVVWDALEGLL